MTNQTQNKQMPQGLCSVCTKAKHIYNLLVPATGRQMLTEMANANPLIVPHDVSLRCVNAVGIIFI